MRKDILEGDFRNFTAPVYGRRFGEAPDRRLDLSPSVAEMFLRLSSNRKHLRLQRPEQDLIHGYAQIADSVEGFSFQDKRAFVVMDAEQLIPNGTYRVGRIFNMGTDSMRLAVEIVNDAGNRELFSQAIIAREDSSKGEV